MNVFVSHFSILDLEQCHHVGQIMTILNRYSTSIPQVLVGDFNTYIDFEWAMDYLTAPIVQANPTNQRASRKNPTNQRASRGNAQNERSDKHVNVGDYRTGAALFLNDVDHHPCGQVFRDQYNGVRDYVYDEGLANQRASEKNPTNQRVEQYFGVFRDIWDEIYPTNEVIRLKQLERYPNTALGFTFPTFADDRILEACRPDRILVREGSTSLVRLDECDIVLVGDQSFMWPSGEEKKEKKKENRKKGKVIEKDERKEEEKQEKEKEKKPMIMYPSDHLGVFSTYCVRIGAKVTPPRYPGELKTHRTLALKNRPWQTPITDEQTRMGTPPTWLQPGGGGESQLAPVLVLDSVLTSTLSTWSTHKIEYSFDGNEKTYFWSDRPVNDGDVVVIRLKKAHKLTNFVYVSTGDPHQSRTESSRKDSLSNGVLEVGFELTFGLEEEEKKKGEEEEGEEEEGEEEEDTCNTEIASCVEKEFNSTICGRELNTNTETSPIIFVPSESFSIDGSISAQVAYDLLRRGLTDALSYRDGTIWVSEDKVMSNLGQNSLLDKSYVIGRPNIPKDRTDSIFGNNGDEKNIFGTLVDELVNRASVRAIRLRALQSQESWIMISEFSID